MSETELLTPEDDSKKTEDNVPQEISFKHFFEEPLKQRIRTLLTNPAETPIKVTQAALETDMEYVLGLKRIHLKVPFLKKDGAYFSKVEGSWDNEFIDKAVNRYFIELKHSLRSIHDGLSLILNRQPQEHDFVYSVDGRSPQVAEVKPVKETKVKKTTDVVKKVKVKETKVKVKAKVAQKTKAPRVSRPVVNKNLKKAIDIVGGTKALITLIGGAQSNIYRLLTTDAKINLKLATAISEATQGVISVRRLYGALPKAVAKTTKAKQAQAKPVKKVSSKKKK